MSDIYENKPDGVTAVEEHEVKDKLVLLKCKTTDNISINNISEFMKIIKERTSAALVLCIPEEMMDVSCMESNYAIGYLEGIIETCNQSIEIIKNSPKHA